MKHISKEDYQKHLENLTFQPPHLNFEGLKEKGCNYKNWNISRRKSAF